MTAELLGAVALFALVTTVTPGPNNTLLLASGLHFGVRRSVPQVLGIALGLILLMLAVGFGLGAVFEAWPPLQRILQALAVGYLLWLAWGLARSSGGKGGGEMTRPVTLLESAAFQWVNPKAWVMVLGAVSAYIPADGHTVNVLLVALVFALVCLPSCAVWVTGGRALRRVLGTPQRLRLFNLTMAALLVVSLIPILLH